MAVSKTALSGSNPDAPANKIATRFWDKTPAHSFSGHPPVSPRTIRCMTTLTHIAVAAMIAKAVLTGHKIDADPAVVYGVAIFFSNIPDIDIPIFGIRRALALKWNHRIQSFFHFPLFWIILYLIAETWAPLNIRQTIDPYMTIALVSLGIHFLMDTTGVHSGICWFGPFIKKQFSFTRLINRPETIGTFVLTYCKSAVFKVEMLIWTGCVIYLLIKPV